MFILYAIPVGIITGYLLGGRLEGVARVRFRWIPLALVGLAVQVALFSDPLSGIVGDAGPLIYAASTLAVLVAVLRNVDIPGIAIVALGASSNLLAILANGGYMPADPDAVAAIGGVGPGYSNSSVVAHPALEALTDTFAMPAWIPLANVFSIGDVVIGAGIALTIALGMRVRPAPGTAAAER